MRVGTVRVAGLILAAGCASNPKSWHRPPPAAAATPPSERSASPAGYLLASNAFEARSERRAWEDESGSLIDAGRVIGGMRVAISLSARLGVPDDPPLRGGLRIRPDQGGGFLFWTSDTWYRADTFLGTLVCLGAAPGQASRVSQHPKGLLLRFSDGSRGVFDPRTGQPVPESLDGVVDVHSLSNGYGLALLIGGAARATRDRGTSWTDLAPSLPVAVAAIDRQAKALWLELTDGTTFRLGPDATPEPARPPVPLVDPHRPLRTSPPIEHVVKHGLSLDSSIALAYENNALWRVRLPHGEPLRSVPLPLPPGTSCELVRGSEQALLVCALAGNGALVYSGLRAERPTLEARLPETRAKPPLAVADGVLAWDGGCGPMAVDGHVCLRGLDGKWWDRDVAACLVPDGSDAGTPKPPAQQPPSPQAKQRAGSARSATAPTGPRSVRRWIPAVDGNVLAWMESGPPCSINARSGKAVRLDQYPLDGVPNRVQPSAGRGLLDQGWRLDARGHVLAYSDTAILEIDPSHGVVPAKPLPGRATWSGPRGIACTPNQQCWQTRDWGESWEPIGDRLPPFGSFECSELGCVMGHVVRLGWEAGGNLPPQPPPASKTPAVFPKLLRRLACEPAQAIRSATVPYPEDSERYVLGLGARRNRLPTSNGDTSTHVWDPSVSDATELPMARIGARAETGRWVEWMAPFDTQGRVHSTWAANAAFISAALRAGADQEAAMDDVVAGTAVPILDARDDELVGVLLGREGGRWLVLHPRPERAEPHFLGVEAKAEAAVEYGNVVSAVALRPGSIALLLSGSSTDRVLVSSRVGIRQAWQWPHSDEADAPNPPALAIDVQGGLSVVYTLSGAAPASDADAAIAIDGKGGRRRLAPWSTLRTATDRDCTPAPDDLRVVLGTSKRWVEAYHASAAVVPDSGMYALVRWNAERVCLVALETLFDPVMLGTSSENTRIVARFDRATAARIAIREGGESRQAMSCRLE